MSQPAGVREVNLRANGLRFRCLEAGPAHGPPALLLHGFPEGAESWLPQLEALAAAGTRAVAPDLRGYGGSDCPEGTAAYALDHLVADVRELARLLGGRCHLAGHDWGALVGWAFVSRHPELARSWASLSVAHPAALAAARHDPDQQARSAYIRLFLRTGKAEEVLGEDGQRRLRETYRVGPNPDAIPAEVVELYARSLARPGRLTAALDYYRANLGDATWGGLASVGPVRVPTLLVWGDQDPALGRAAVDATPAHVAAPYRLEVLGGAGHWLQFERPEAISRLLVEHAAST
jgi:pimeloyl-ACP methyl ester carboxylesterase